jgi:TonB-dependent starch-binding outer membrane protein SusC
MKVSRKLFWGAALLALSACGGPGLPAAGPKPGEVDTGYGTQPAEKTTGSITTVTDKPTGPMRLEELLRGKAAGVQIVTRPDGTQALRIRGGTPSLQTGQDQQEPLVVVDGIQLSQNGLTTALAGLTPQDIRQVDVLKDVASTAVYGVRGAAGVIVITTNRR